MGRGVNEIDVNGHHQMRAKGWLSEKVPNRFRGQRKRRSSHRTKKEVV